MRVGLVFDEGEKFIKNVYYGYAAEREMLTDYLQSIDVSPQKI